MKYAEIRQAFIEYFESRKHKHVESSSLIPHGDPTLMFTNAGMNQFKDVFLGQDQRDYNRAVSVQKCLRAGGKHNDLENVGFTARHHTFFEMLGNFSFGDYFKEEAISMAWEFLTVVLKIPKERLYVTVFTTDDEAADIWHKKIGIPKEKITRFGEKDNFWRMGQTGPCGPCSEIFYDHNPTAPPVPLDQDEDRFVEIWNLVFMQFYEDESGKQTPLPKPSVDTGAGIERMAAALQGVRDNYQSDVFTPMIAKACQLADLEMDWSQLSKQPEVLGSLKVVADHARAATFLISEGVLPSNEGRGYVLRRIMRRAIRYARKLNKQKSIYPEICTEVIAHMGEFHPILIEKRDFILRTVQDEETRFLQTLDRGSDILSATIEGLQKNKQKTLDGLTAFTLYDTFGFPFDLTQVIAKEHGLCVSEDDFNQHLELAKNKARKAQKTHKITANEKHLTDWSQKAGSQFGPTRFLGYETLQTTTQILALSDGTQEVTQLKGGSGFIIVSETPFYAEGGGQVSDQGYLIEGSPEEARKIGRILDCQKINDIFLHQVDLGDNKVLAGQAYSLQVAPAIRQSTANNHSATHLLNAALRKVLGDHVSQAGSLVTPDKLRFDFNHSIALSESELGEVENLVNQQISLAVPVQQIIQSQEEAIAQGAVAMFGEKYGDRVRVISMGEDSDFAQRPFSKELCGGTHVQNTSEIRMFKIISEAGVAAGVRRIEAITGQAAYHYLNGLAVDNLLTRQILNIPPPKISEFIDASVSSSVSRLSPVEAKKSETALKLKEMLDKIKFLEKELQKAKSESVSNDDLIQQAQETTFKGQKVLALFTRVDIDDRKALSQIVDQLRDKHSNLFLVLIGESAADQAKPVIVAVGKGLKGLHAGQTLKSLCEIMDGKGGGRPDFAQGSVANLDKLNLAKTKFYELFS